VHIFLKDARHQWLEILISLVATSALVVESPTRWHTGLTAYVNAFSYFAFSRNLPELLILIVPLSWWLLISPVIHEEKLVGDRQFWITRPYEWKKLLAAKILFLIVFLYIPLMVAQSAMLVGAGFSPFSSVGGLLENQLGLMCAVVLPLVALSTVTRNFARMTLALLGALVCLIAIAAMASAVPPDRVAIPHSGEIFFWIVLCLCGAVIILQYARRNAKVSWIMLVLLVVLFGAFDRGGSSDDAQMNRKYPPGQAGAGMAQFAYQEKQGEASSFVTQYHDWVGIAVPVDVSGVAEGTITIPDFVKVTLQAPGGKRWTSTWQGASIDKLFSGGRVVNAQFAMPRAVYEEFIGKPIGVQMTFALTQARAETPMRLTLNQNDFAVPEVGMCSPVWYGPGEIGSIVCRSALRQPPLTAVNSNWSADAGGCKSSNGDDGVQTAAWIGALEKGSPEFGLIPVSVAPVNFTNQFITESNRPTYFRHLCPGTPITFTGYRLSGRGQATFSINGFQLPRLDAGQMKVINQD
jgi:hypothetical protein